MRAVALEGRPVHEWLILGLAALLSVSVHAVGAVGAASIPPREREAATWVEMAVISPPEPPPAPVEPEPEPLPEPEPPPPEPPPVPTPRPQPQPQPVEEVEYTPEPEVPPEPQPPLPEAKPVPRAVQGLSADSFANTGQGPAVRQGNTTATRATPDALPEPPAGEYAIVPYTAVSKPPRIRYKPNLPIPPEVIDAQIEGRVEIALTIDADGLVAEVTLIRSLHPAADAACLDSMRSSRWRAGTRDERPVITRGVPYSCRFQMAVD